MEQKPKRTLKVFVVEDSEKISNWIKSELEEFDGVSVQEIGGRIESAKKQIWKNKPDVVTLDIRLSDGSGMEILKRIKSENLGIKVIVFTNYPWQVFQKQCLDLGADYFFDKMQDSEKLVEAIKDIQSNINGEGNMKNMNSILI